MATPSKKLSAEGQSLVADFRDVVKQAQHLLLSKNDGNLLQDFIWQSQHISGGDAALPGAPVNKDQAKQHGNEALEGLRTLGTLLISNGQFRKLCKSKYPKGTFHSNRLVVNDATVLLRDIAGDAATNAAGKVRPNEDQLNQIDAPAEDNTWHENPDVSSGNIKNQFKNTVNKKSPVDKNDLQAARDDAQNQGDAQQSAIQGASTLKDRANAGISEDKKDRARETRAKTRNYLESKMPEERREQTIWRLKKLVVEVQGHPDCIVFASRCFFNVLTRMQINKPSTPFSISRKPMAAMQPLSANKALSLSKEHTLIVLSSKPKLTLRYGIFHFGRNQTNTNCNKDTH